MNLESVAKKLFVGTGLVLGAAVAMTPLATHAAIITEEGTAGTTRDVQTETGVGYTHCYDDNLSNDGTPVTVPCSRGMEVAFNVQPTITIDALAYPGQENDDTSSDGDTEFYQTAPIVLSPTVIREGKITASVTANTQYSLSVNADHGMTSMQHETNENGLIPASSKLVGGTAGWGIKTSGTTEGEGTYRAIEETPYTYFRTTDKKPVQNAKHDLTVGIAASPNLPSGIYQATVVITATATI